MPRRSRRAFGRIALVVAVLAVDVIVLRLVWPDNDVRQAAPPVPSTLVDASWTALDASGRCGRAEALVRWPVSWPVLCRWRLPSDAVKGVSFPPPVGPPPWDNPRIEIYVGEGQTPAEVAHAIAHEMGHMHHTREATLGEAWLAARGLPPGTDWQAWVEDYAEAFAAVYGPPVPGWAAPTTRPSEAGLQELDRRFFQPGRVTP